MKPLLGNEFVVGALDAESFTADDADARVVGAIEVEDKEALERLLDKGKAKEIGESGGAKLYSTEDDDAVAIEDDTFIVANDRKDLEEAIERRDGDDQMTEERFDEGLEDLPEDALVRAFFDVKQLLDGRSRHRRRAQGRVRERHARLRAHRVVRRRCDRRGLPPGHRGRGPRGGATCRSPRASRARR